MEHRKPRRTNTGGGRRKTTTARDESSKRDASGSSLIPSYEDQLASNSRWALNEGGRHFEEKSKVFQALQKITSHLEKLKIPYVVVGGMALFRHGFRRFTDDVDLLVTKDDLRTVHSKLSGRGYLPVHAHSKHLRDTELAVRIEFLTTGGYPGDGKKKPVAFPDPRDVAVETDGIRYVNLPTLVELKLASGMTNAARLRDLSDVQELIKALKLPLEFGQQLDPYVRNQYTKLWKGAKKYDMVEESEYWGIDEDESDSDRGERAE